MRHSSLKKPVAGRMPLSVTKPTLLRVDCKARGLGLELVDPFAQAARRVLEFAAARRSAPLLAAPSSSERLPIAGSSGLHPTAGAAARVSC
jgi:hypothetical protein